MNFYSDTVKSEDLLYYNIGIVNAKYIDDGSDNPYAKFEEDLPLPLLENPSDWEMAIVRGTEECGFNLPIYIFPVQINQSNVNLGVQSVTITMDIKVPAGTTSYVSQQFLQWIPEDQLAQIPLPPSTSQNVNNQYYWVYTYSHYVDIINTALQACITDISTRSGLQLKTTAPILTYEPTSKLFSIYYDTQGFGGNARASKGTSQDENATLFMNSSLFQMFYSFPSLYVNNDIANFGTAYKLNVVNKVGLNNYTYNDISYFVMTQDCNSLTCWSPISCIAYKSDFLPVKKEYTSNPIIYDSSNVGAVVQSTYLNESVITDVSLALDSPDQYRELLTYVPSGEYRMLSLVGNQPISKIDISLYYRLKMTNQLIPVRMPNYSTVTLKILFRRRV